MAPSPEESPHPTPHDAVFKAVFSVPEHALGVLRAALPPELCRAIDASSLRPEQGTYVDPALRSRHTDVLLSGTLSGGERPLFLYYLFEHQSGPSSPLLVYRMVVYTTRILDAWLARNEGATELPLVIPIVVCQSASGWTGARRLSEVLCLPAPLEAPLRRHVLEVELVLFELSARASAALLALDASPLARLTLLLLKHAFLPGGVLSALSLAAAALAELFARDPRGESLAPVLRYTREVARIPETQALDAVARVLGPEEGRALKKTFGAEIEQLGARKLVERQLTKKFGALPDAIKARLEAASQPDLDRWAERLLDAKKLDDVFAD